jgi:tRNA G10  N-methylase Trm11
MTCAENVTVGWTDCGHVAWRPGVVLDPFAGSGTSLAVATGHGRDALGFDLDERNVDLARDRVGPMFFTDLTLAEWIDLRAAS